MLGMICSDDVYAGTKDNLIGSFNRVDCGDEYVDHHVLFVVHNERGGLNHMSFEVPDVDAVFADHEYLARLGKYEHMWGVGRHLLGSQVYDYWCDPWGRVHERWADTDRLNARTPGTLLPAEEALVSQWGEAPPEKFIKRVVVWREPLASARGHHVSAREALRDRGARDGRHESSPRV